MSIGRGDILHKPRVMWIKDRRSDTIKCYRLDSIQVLCFVLVLNASEKGKWNEITKGDKYDMTTDSNKYTLRFIKPKMNDSGLYTVKVVSRQETVVETFNLTVGPYIDDGSGIIIGKAAGYV